MEAIKIIMKVLIVIRRTTRDVPTSLRSHQVSGDLFLDVILIFIPTYVALHNRPILFS